MSLEELKKLREMVPMTQQMAILIEDHISLLQWKDDLRREIEGKKNSVPCDYEPGSDGCIVHVDCYLSALDEILTKFQ